MTSPVCQLYHPQLPGTLISLTHADTFSQQRLDPEKQFQVFAHGIVSYLLVLDCVIFRV